MNNENEIEVPEENESAGLPVVIDKRPPVESRSLPGSAPVTAAQAKVEAIADLTHSAYQKAATLQLTKEESDQLQADFPDEAFKPGAAGKENLIYVEHAFLRDRFIKVFGLGGWAIIPRSRWAEPFITAKGVEGSRVYVEAMLVVRGCFVAEAIGEMEYYPKNASQNYGDAVEGATTAAFRRCAKNFGVGLQAWKKDWCQGWMDRKMAPGKRVFPKPAAPAAKPTPPKKDVKMPTESTRKWMIEQLQAGEGHGNRKVVEEYFQKIGQLIPNEQIEDLALRFVPFSKQELDFLVNCLSNFEAGGEAIRAFTPHGEADEPAKKKGDFDDPVESPEEEEWRSFPMPFGKNSGVAMEDLPKNYLFGLWANYTVETEYNGKPKKPETIAKDTKFREMLNQAGEHYKFDKKD